MARHADLRIGHDLPVYFCDPQSPLSADCKGNRLPGKAWQRGTNENTNGLLQQYFPKETDLAAHGRDDLNAVAAPLNGQPRKTLGWKTPAEALDELLDKEQTARVATTG